jgi:hypothetical protein
MQKDHCPWTGRFGGRILLSIRHLGDWPIHFPGRVELRPNEDSLAFVGTVRRSPSESASNDIVFEGGYDETFVCCRFESGLNPLKILDDLLVWDVFSGTVDSQKAFRNVRYQCDISISPA